MRARGASPFVIQSRPFAFRRGCTRLARAGTLGCAPRCSWWYRAVCGFGAVTIRSRSSVAGNGNGTRQRIGAPRDLVEFTNVKGRYTRPFFVADLELEEKSERYRNELVNAALRRAP